MIFKNDALKVERIPKIFENLNSFEMMLKMLKNYANTFKKINFWIFIVFHYFWILFLKIYQNMGQKLGSNMVNPLSPFFFLFLQSLLPKVSCETFYHKHCKGEGATIITHFWVIPQIHLFSFQIKK